MQRPSRLVSGVGTREGTGDEMPGENEVLGNLSGIGVSDCFGARCALYSCQYKDKLTTVW